MRELFQGTCGGKDGAGIITLDIQAIAGVCVFLIICLSLFPLQTPCCQIIPTGSIPVSDAGVLSAPAPALSLLAASTGLVTIL